MKRNPDLERDILLLIEAHDFEGGFFVDLSSLQQQHSRIEVGYHVMLLTEAGLVDAKDCTTMGEAFDWQAIRLTMPGHQYLEDIRDSEVWRKTKAGAEKVGSFSLDVLSAVAKGVIKTKLKKHAGLDADL